MVAHPDTVHMLPRVRIWIWIFKSPPAVREASWLLSQCCKCLSIALPPPFCLLSSIKKKGRERERDMTSGKGRGTQILSISHKTWQQYLHYYCTSIQKYFLFCNLIGQRATERGERRRDMLCSFVWQHVLPKPGIVANFQGHGMILKYKLGLVCSIDTTMAFSIFCPAIHLSTVVQFEKRKKNMLVPLLFARWINDKA